MAIPHLLMAFALCWIGIATAEPVILDNMGAEHSYNFRRINDEVTTSGIVGEDNLKAMGSEGYSLVVNLLPDESEHAVEAEREILESQGIRYIYIPVDFSNPTLEDFQMFTAALDQAGDGQVHIHCAANYRVSAFYSLYALKAGTMTEAQSETLIESIWNPSESPVWVDFMKAVRAAE